MTNIRPKTIRPKQAKVTKNPDEIYCMFSVTGLVTLNQPN